eukprot:433222-Rhodomonas_salina.1
MPLLALLFCARAQTQAPQRKRFRMVTGSEKRKRTLVNVDCWTHGCEVQRDTAFPAPDLAAAEAVRVRWCLQYGSDLGRMVIVSVMR